MARYGTDYILLIKILVPSSIALPRWFFTTIWGIFSIYLGRWMSVFSRLFTENSGPKTSQSGPEHSNPYKKNTLPEYKKKFLYSGSLIRHLKWPVIFFRLNMNVEVTYVNLPIWGLDGWWVFKKNKVQMTYLSLLGPTLSRGSTSH